MIRKAGVESPESRAERAHFPEELHAAGLRLFDLIASVDLPDPTRLPEKDRISTLRKKIRRDLRHRAPLRAALFSRKSRNRADHRGQGVSAISAPAEPLIPSGLQLIEESGK